LIKEPPRPGGAYRQYPEETVSRIRFIRRAQGLGFSLKEIKELLSLRVNPSLSCAAVKAKAQEKLDGIDQRITHLQEIRHALAALAAQCSGKGPTSACPILEALDKNPK
jgi:MerR family mercuric resistance operon transcriptional regulator